MGYLGALGYMVHLGYMDIHLRRFDDELWRSVRSIALERGVSAKSLVEDYVRSGLGVVPAQVEPRERREKPNRISDIIRTVEKIRQQPAQALEPGEEEEDPDLPDWITIPGRPGKVCRRHRKQYCDSIECEGVQR